MRILHVLNHTYKSNGHVHAAIDLACAQRVSGHEVTIASSGGDFSNILEKNSVMHIELKLNRHPFSILKASWKLIKIVKQFDIVHAHMVLSAILSVPACKLNKTPLITTIHNEFNREAILMGVGKRIIAVSGAVAQSMERRGIPKSRLRTVLNGTIGTPRCTGPIGASAIKKSPSILFVGGLHPRKGVIDLINAFIILSKYFTG
ncbi:glycosyltransferase family 4 protein, partial [Methylobacterium sp. WL119]|uniref:glycosyltransferase family 4 protein n=2 Tax=unclassified Methylobacterium TaxID=2615210 RepID=UPI0011C804A8